MGYILCRIAYLHTFIDLKLHVNIVVRTVPTEQIVIMQKVCIIGKKGCGRPIRRPTSCRYPQKVKLHKCN